MSVSRASAALVLIPIACLAVLVHGYHLGADDAAIYIPAVKQAADPSLYPFGAEFFQSQAGLSLLPKLIGIPARVTHIPIDLMIFLWHIAVIYLLLLATWRLASACFESVPARWGAVLLMAGVLSVPVAGTALVIMDPYVTARSLSTPAALFAIAAFLENERWAALVVMLLGALAIHPQMGYFAAALLGVQQLTKRTKPAAQIATPGEQVTAALALLPFGWKFQPERGLARQALVSRSYFFVTTWHWYEWAGAIAPLVLLAFWGSIRPRGVTPAFRRIAGALVPYGLLFTAAALVLVTSPRLEGLNRLQPMRSFHLLYCIFFALLGGLIGEYALGRHLVAMGQALFAPLAAGMWFVQAGDYKSSPHVEWPGRAGGNTWMQAFYWIRQNTPKDALFAMDPVYMALPGEDQHGFRAVAERSVLADFRKDSGPVALFPKAWPVRNG